MASPNMNLEIPFVLVTTDPLWAQYINDSLELIDEHNHTPGSGVLIPSAGININADLDMNDNDLIATRTVRFTSQASTPVGVDDLDIIYVKNNELCYRDDAGQEVQLTLNGSINVSGGIGVIAGLVAPASAVYSPVTGTFIWSKDTNKPAKMITSDISIYEYDDAAAFPVTIKTANVTAAYDLTLPIEPSPLGLGLLIMDSAGSTAVAASIQGGGSYNDMIVSSSAGGTSFEVTKLKNASIDDTTITYPKLNIADTEIPYGKQASRPNLQSPGPGIGPGVAALSTTSGAYSTSSASFTTVFTTYCSIKNGGGIIEVTMTPDGSALASIILASGGIGRMRLLRDGAAIAEWELSDGVEYAPGSFLFAYQEPAAGVHTFDIQVRIPAGTFFLSRTKLYVKEM